jgi:methionyl-tRNA formyltransferase
MKFIIIASGLIAENFIASNFFKMKLIQDIVGLVATKKIVENMNENLTKEFIFPILTIDKSKRNECQLIDFIKKIKPDYVISIQYPWILSNDVLGVLDGRFLNLHNAKLPDYRGHNSITHEILNFEQYHFSTLHLMTNDVDRGNLIMSRKIPIKKNDTAHSLWLRSVKSSILILQNWFQTCKKNNNFPKGKKILGEGNYYPKEFDQLKRVPENSSAEVIERWARAFFFPPYEPAYIMYGEKKVYVLPEQYSYTQKDILAQFK